MLHFTGERIVPGSTECEPTFADKMYQEHIGRYAFAARYASGARVLDVGCGVGYGSQWLAKAGATSVLAIDIAEDAVEHARNNYLHPAVRFEVRSAIDFSIPKSFDLVTCFELIEHVHEQERVLDNIAEALCDDGVLVISTPRPLDEIRTHFHERELNFEEIFDLLAARFKNVRPFFQTNCFTSYLGSGKPSSIEEIVHISDRFSLDKADYFIFVASNAEIDDRSSPPLLSMNDDSYILTLEKDVSILRGADNYHKGLIADLEERVRQLQEEALEEHARARAAAESQAAESHARAAEAEERAKQADAARVEIERHVATREAMLRVSDEKIAELASRIMTRDQEAEILRGETLSAQAQARSLRDQFSSGVARWIEHDLAAARSDIEAMQSKLRLQNFNDRLAHEAWTAENGVALETSSEPDAPAPLKHRKPRWKKLLARFARF